MKQMILLCCLFAHLAMTAQAQENWTQFRGQSGQGLSQATGLPERWSADENIAWKTDIPGKSWSSPIVWNDHIFLTTATEKGDQCYVIAVDRKTGAILWNKMVLTQEPELHRHDLNTHATPTPVTDGKYVFAVFSGGSFVALDFEGNIKWTNSDLKYYSHHGMGVSPILYGDLLIFAVNPSSKEEPMKGWQTPWDGSYLLALDKNTGKERWRGSRGLTCISHSTPIIAQINGKDQIISSVGNAVQGFDPSNGKLIWTVANSGEPCVPSPVYGDGLVFVTTANSNPIRAVRTNGQGDCTATHIAWEQKGYSPMMCSFLYIKPCLYTCTDNRNFNCLDASTGELLWRLPLRGGELNPSPIYADGKIYVLSEAGTTFVLRPAADPKQPAEIIATNELNEKCKASIAIAGKQFIIRTDTRLLCIGK